MEQGPVIKSDKTPKQEAETKLREQDILNTPEAQKMLADMVAAELAKRQVAPTVQQPPIDTSAIVEAVIRGNSAARNADSGVAPRQMGIQGNIPYIAKDEDLNEEVTSFKCNMVHYLLWPATLPSGKFWNSPTGGAAVFWLASARAEGEQTVVESYYHTKDKNWIKFIEGHPDFGTIISRAGEKRNSQEGLEVATAVKWFNFYVKMLPAALDREINMINASLPEDQQIPKGDPPTMRQNLAGYRTKLELESNKKPKLSADQAREAALSAATV